jgi:hypothetical protein
LRGPSLSCFSVRGVSRLAVYTGLGLGFRLWGTWRDLITIPGARQRDPPTTTIYASLMYPTIFKKKRQTYNYHGHTPEVDALCARLMDLCADYDCEGPPTCLGPGAGPAKQFNLNTAFLHPRLILCKEP